MIYLKDDTIPKPLYDALVASSDSYANEVRQFKKENNIKGFNISTTALISPARAVALVKRHHEDIIIDPLKDLWHSMMGSIVHWVLEKYADNERYVTEVREHVVIDVDGKKCIVHGKFDLYDKETKELTDWKLTSPQSMMYPKEEHHKQLNILKYILESAGWEVKKIGNMYLFPHLDKTKMKMPGYPQRSAMYKEAPIYSREEVEEYIRERLRAHIAAESQTDSQLTECTNDERWIRNSVYHLYLRKKAKPFDFSSRKTLETKGRKKILRYLKAEGIKKKDAQIVYKRGFPTKCGYCDAAPFCKQYQDEKLQLEPQTDE